MLKRLTFDAYAPDTPLGINDGANVLAMPNGYRPTKGFSPVSTALPGIVGGASFSNNGTRVMLGGTPTNLYVYSGTTWTNKLGSITSAKAWYFDQFGDNVICVNGGAPVSYSISAGTAANLGGSPPSSSLVATVRNQVFLAGDPSNRNQVAISGYNNSAGWTAGTNQCIYVPFPNGGDIMGLCGGETGLILQRSSVRRATYTGDVTVWQFDEISKDVGCMASGSVAQAGNLAFFLSDQGFKMCDRNVVTPIGLEQVDRTFFALYNRLDIIDKLRAAIDPRETTVTWAMPGNPGRLWRYNWALQKWSPPLELNNLGVFQGFSKNYTIEEIDTLFPGGIDSVPYSLDSTAFSGGDPLLFAINGSGIVGTLTGTNVAAYMTLAPLEIEPGRRVRITGARVVGDVTSGTVTVDARARAGDAVNPVTSGSMRDNGRVPLRANGRHVGVRLDIPASDWSYVLGVDIEYAVSGAR